MRQIRAIQANINLFKANNGNTRAMCGISAFSPNTGKCGREIIPYLDIFHAVMHRQYVRLHVGGVGW